MLIAAAQIKLYAPWVHSLKEKRMVVKSLIGKIRNRFNVSAAEVGDQELHQTILIGIACVTDSSAQADSVMEHVIRFMESNTEAEILDIIREIR